MSEQLGKIDRHLFERFIPSHCGYQRAEVRVKPAFGTDVSLIDLPGNLTMALTSDPLSLIPSLGLEASAWLSVHLMANDMATTGFAPQYGQFVLNLPDHFSKADFQQYWQYMHTFCQQVGIAITGGHTGFIPGQNSTIAGGGTLVAVAPQGQMLVSGGAQAGNVVLVTKECAMSSAAILAMSFPQRVKQHLGADVYHRACDLFYQTSSLQDGLVAAGRQWGCSEVTAMHDVTEGGVLGAIYELCCASGTGALLYNDALPIGDVPRQVCALFNIDPRYCIGAGAMIVTCAKAGATAVIQRLQQAGIPCRQVGELTAPACGIQLVENGEVKPLVYHEEDPYWAAFFNALNNGWK